MENKLDKQVKFIELRAKGVSFDNIAKELRVSKSTLIEWSKLMNKEIQTEKNLEMDRILENYRISQNHQIESLGIQLSKIRDELKTRDLSDISTERLIMLQMKLSENIEKIRKPITIHSNDAMILDLGSEWEV